MDVRWISDGRLEAGGPESLDSLLARDDGFLWVDLMADEPDAQRVLADVFRFHPLAVHDSLERNHLPKVHVYREHLFVVLHAPQAGRGGHVHYLELDQFVGGRYLVTVHGPLNPAVDPVLALRETQAVLERLRSGHFAPESPYHLSYALVSALARWQEAYASGLARESGVLEQQVMAGYLGDAETFLEQLFRVRQQLLAVRTMATLAGANYGRINALARLLPDRARPWIADTEDQFERVAAVCDGQMEFVHGVIEHYQARTNTKMTIAAERLAVVASLTLPVTAIASVYGMNIIVYGSTQVGHLVVVLAAMVGISALMLAWARRHGWW